ncbi:hypothetical protein ACFXBB_19375 [Streptomyces scopuliridis]|uniref:hypothetical protein n=1 Tax=Streptomyces scopuliridis TaxID=452529 RepID=UPI0036A412D8
MDLEEKLTEGEGRAARSAVATLDAERFVRLLVKARRTAAIVTNILYSRGFDATLLKPHPDSLHRAMGAPGFTADETDGLTSRVMGASCEMNDPFLNV